MIKAAVKSLAIATSSLVLFAAGSAHAGADAVRAKAYFNAISGGDAETIASFYADDAEFHWVGGPLAGVYNGKDKIKGVWEKFSKAAGDLDHEVLQISESANGKVSTVTARVTFKGKGEVPVKFIMMYKDGKIASEVWQVDKPGTVEAKAEPKAGEPAAPVAARAAAPAAAPAPAKAATPEQRSAAVEPKAPAGAQPQRSAANAPAQPPASPDEAGGEPEDGYLPDDAEAPDAKAAAAPPAPPASPAKKAELTPDKDIRAEPKLGGAEPKGKVIGGEKKTGGYAKPDVADAPRFKKKRFHDHGYSGGYGGYGWGGHGGGYGHGGGGY